MLPVITEINVETAAEWITTFAKARERKLVRTGNATIEVSLGAAMVHLMEKRNGFRTIAGIRHGRFDERGASFKPHRGERVYLERLPDDIAGSAYGSASDILDMLDERERIIVEALNAGYTQREIAAQLNLHETRIGQILSIIREKIQNQF